MSHRVALLAVVAAVSQGGCMMAGAMGSMAGRGPTDPASNPAAVSSDVRTAALHVALEAVAVSAGRGVRIAATVRDAASGAPVSRAAVRFRIESASGGDRESVLQAAEAAPGVYEATYAFTAAGGYSMTAEILPGGDKAEAVSVSVRHYVAPAPTPGPRRWWAVPVALAGTAVMLAAMIFM